MRCEPARANQAVRTLSSAASEMTVALDKGDAARTPQRARARRPRRRSPVRRTRRRRVPLTARAAREGPKDTRAHRVELPRTRASPSASKNSRAISPCSKPSPPLRKRRLEQASRSAWAPSSHSKTSTARSLTTSSFPPAPASRSKSAGTAVRALTAQSPLGRQLIGRAEDDEIRVVRPRGPVRRQHQAGFVSHPTRYLAQNMSIERKKHFVEELKAQLAEVVATARKAEVGSCTGIGRHSRRSPYEGRRQGRRRIGAPGNRTPPTSRARQAGSRTADLVCSLRPEAPSARGAKVGLGTLVDVHIDKPRRCGRERRANTLHPPRWRWDRTHRTRRRRIHLGRDPRASPVGRALTGGPRSETASTFSIAGGRARVDRRRCLLALPKTKRRPTSDDSRSPEASPCPPVCVGARLRGCLRLRDAHLAHQCGPQAHRCDHAVRRACTGGSRTEQRRPAARPKHLADTPGRGLCGRAPFSGAD